MNYVISITGPEALGVLEDICEELALPLNVTLHGRGTAVQSMLDLLGIESNEKRRRPVHGEPRKRPPR